MNFKRPENSDKYYWTRHSIGKMMQYGLSAQRITRVIKGYKRIEEGVAKDTIAVMQPTSTRRDEKGELKWNQEIWVMYQLRRKVGANSKFEKSNPKQIPNSKLKNTIQGAKYNRLPARQESSKNFKPSKIKIISAWKFPGMSPKSNPIPQEILEELKNVL